MQVDIQFLLGVILTLMTYSVILKENAASRVVGHIALGIGGGYAVVMGVKYAYERGAVAIGVGDYKMAVTLVLGFMLYLRYFKKTEQLYRLPVAIMIGTLLGLSSRAAMDTQFMRQIVAAINFPTRLDFLQLFNFTVMLVATICVLFYFMFIAGPTGRFGLVKKIGRYALLVGFGATFGNMIMGVFSRLIDRVVFLQAT